MAFDPNTYGAKSGGGFNPDTYGASTTGGPKDFNVNVSHQENLKPRARFKVTVPGLADFDPDGAFSSQEREMRNILMGEDKKKFTSAKIGDELTLSGGKAIKVSEDEIEVPDMEALQNPMESVAIGAGINSPAALAGLAAFGGVSSRVKGIPGMILGAGAGAITAAGTGFGQRKISPDALNELEAETQRRSPVGYNLGRILGSGMKPGGYSGSIGRESAERLLPAGIGAGLQAGVDAYQGKLGTPESNKEILMAAAENLILKDANKLGNKAMGSLAAKPKFKLEIPEPATDITQNLNAKAGQPLTKTQQDAAGMSLGKSTEPTPPELVDLNADSLRGELGLKADQTLLAQRELSAAQKQAEADAFTQNERARGMLAEETALAQGAMDKTEVDANFAAENQKQVERHYQALKDLRESEARANEARKKEADAIKAADEKKALAKEEEYAQELADAVSKQEGIPLQEVIATRQAHPNTKAWVEDMESIFAKGYKLSETPKPKTITDLVESVKADREVQAQKQAKDAILRDVENRRFRESEPYLRQKSRAADVEAALAEAERVRQSQRGGEMLREDLSLRDPRRMPEIAGPQDLVGPRVPDVLTPSRKKTAVAMPEVAKPVESKGIAIPEAPAKPAPTPEPVVEKPALDAKEAIIQDPNLDADTKIEILQKMATAKPKSSVAALKEKLVASSAEAKPKRPSPVEDPKVTARREALSDRVMELEANLDKRGILSAANKAFDSDFINRRQLEEIQRLARDKDMGPEDIGSELRAFIENGKPSAKAKLAEPVAEPTPEPVKETPVVEESAPTDPLGDKLAYLDEQLASKEITKAEHKELVKQAKATVAPRTAKNKQAGFSSGSVMANMAAPAVGAAIGSNIGDTPEERVRNAMIGAGIASGSTALGISCCGGLTESISCCLAALNSCGSLISASLAAV